MWDTLTNKSLTVLNIAKGRAYVEWASGCTGWVNTNRLAEAEIMQVPTHDGQDWNPTAIGPKRT